MEKPIYGWRPGKCDICQQDDILIYRLGDGQQVCDGCWNDLFEADEEV